MYNPRTEEAYQLFHKGILSLARAEEQGMRVDVEYCKENIKKLNKRMSRLEEELKETKFFRHWQHVSKGAVNIHSGAQLSYFLYKIKKIKIEKETASGQGSTDDEALQRIGSPELLTLLEIRRLKKVKDYLELFVREQINGYIHPFFNLHLVPTYRSSSDHPNFQNLPRKDKEAMQIVRGALYPRPGNLLMEIDYSGLEVRIISCYSKDPALLRYINDPKSDMHADMAKRIFKVSKFNKDIPEYNTLRQAAKNAFVFPEFYGSWYKNCAPNLVCNWGKLPQEDRWKSGQGIPMPNGTLSDHLISKGIHSLDSFTNHLKDVEDDFKINRFPEHMEWMDSWYNLYKKQGYVQLYTGFRCSGVMDRKQVINYPIQGSAFHCLLWSFIEIDRILRKRGLNTRLIGQIHDSILLDVHPDELHLVKKLVRRVTCERLVETWKWIIVPLDIEMELCAIDAPWAEKQKVGF